MLGSQNYPNLIQHHERSSGSETSAGLDDEARRVGRDSNLGRFRTRRRGRPQIQEPLAQVFRRSPTRPRRTSGSLRRAASAAATTAASTTAAPTAEQAAPCSPGKGPDSYKQPTTAATEAPAAAPTTTTAETAHHDSTKWTHTSSTTRFSQQQQTTSAAATATAGA